MRSLETTFSRFLGPLGMVLLEICICRLNLASSLEAHVVVHVCSRTCLNSPPIIHFTGHAVQDSTLTIG